VAAAKKKTVKKPPAPAVKVATVDTPKYSPLPHHNVA
jgi:hypothetical protein